MGSGVVKRSLSRGLGISGVVYVSTTYDNQLEIQSAIMRKQA